MAATAAFAELTGVNPSVGFPTYSTRAEALAILRDRGGLGVMLDAAAVLHGLTWQCRADVYLAVVNTGNPPALGLGFAGGIVLKSITGFQIRAHDGWGYAIANPKTWGQPGIAGLRPEKP
jgi:hypothetical protein